MNWLSGSTMGKLVNLNRGAKISIGEWKALKLRRKRLDALRQSVADLEAEYEQDLRGLYGRIEQGARLEDNGEE